jgi:hypothetical protein
MRSSPRFPSRATSATTARWRRGYATRSSPSGLPRSSASGERRNSAVYYVGLLRFIGCSGYADETSKFFPDDNAMRGAMAPVDFDYPVEGLRQAATLGHGALGRTRAIATMVVRGKRLGEELQRADCEVMIRGAKRLGLPAAVGKGLGDAYERWDGKGGPRGVRAGAIEMSARILAVAHQAEIHFRIGGLPAARAMIQRGTGGWFDPEVAETLLKHADRFLAPLTASSVWQAVLGEEPFRTFTWPFRDSRTLRGCSGKSRI